MLLFATLFSHQEASSCVSPASCLTREISRGFFWDGISLEQNTLCVCAWRFRLAAQWRRGGGCVFVFFSGCWFYLPTYQFRGRNTFSWEMKNSKQKKKCYTFDNEDADVAFDDYKRSLRMSYCSKLLLKIGLPWPSPVASYHRSGIETITSHFPRIVQCSTILFFLDQYFF